jgi:hypothetical protein
MLYEPASGVVQNKPIAGQADRLLLVLKQENFPRVLFSCTKATFYSTIVRYCSIITTRLPTLQRHLVVKLLLICNLEKMAENALPSMDMSKIINLQST